MTTVKYFEYIRAKLKRAANKNDEITKRIQVADFQVEFSFYSENLVPIFYNAFEHLSSIKHQQSTKILKIHFWEYQEEQIEIIWDINERHHLGYVETLSENGFFLLHQPGSEAIYLLDQNLGEAYYLVKSADRIPHWESDFPLRMLFHWWLKDEPYQPVHAAAVGIESGGLLLIGKGGSGKSTSTLKCVNSNLKVAGDDYILLDSEQAVAHSLFSLTKANLQSLEMLTNLSITPESLPKPIDDKYRIRLYPRYQDNIINQVPIRACLLPQVTDQDFTSIEPCSSAEILLALAPTTLFQLPGLRQEAFTKMSNFCRNTPGYRLLLGKDSFRLPEILSQFLSTCDKL